MKRVGLISTMFVVVFSLVARSGFAQADSSSQRDPNHADDVSSVYTDFKLNPSQVMTRPGDAPGKAVSSVLCSMVHRLTSRQLGDDVTQADIAAWSASIADPQAEAEIMRRCEEVVREEIKKRGLPLTLIPGRIIELSPRPAVAATDGGPGAMTVEEAFREAIQRQQRRVWNMTFNLAYESIPLDPSSGVSVLARGDKLLIEWRNVPGSNELLAVEKLGMAVTAEQSIEVGKADFRRRQAARSQKVQVTVGAGGQKNDDELTVTKPREQLWIGPDGIGRLVWDFAVTEKKSAVFPPALRIQYQVEARVPPGSTGPSVLTISTGPSSLKATSRPVATELGAGAAAARLVRH